MRDINKQIKREFLNYLSIYHYTEEYKLKIGNNSYGIGLARQFLNLSEE